MAILQVENLTFTYPEAKLPALTEVSFSIEEGEFTVICGMSGCGKSTLLSLIKRETAPFGNKKGKIVFDGSLQENLDNRASCSDIGFVRQRPESQIVTDKVWHELAFGLESLGLPSPVIRRRVAETATFFGIDRWYNKKTTELSGGQKQLLNLAAVTVMHPKLLLLDEPTAQLDPIASSDFINTLRKLNRELGLTVLLVEHRLEDVLPIADRVLLVDEGKIVFDGSPHLLTDFFDENAGHPMEYALPSAARIFRMLGSHGSSPLTVRDGHTYLTRNYNNTVRSLDKKQKTTTAENEMSVKDVYFRYEKSESDVLRGISLDIHKGEHLCILGGNGTGKTTLLNILSGLMKPYRGKVTLGGKTLTKYSQAELYRNNLAMLPQDPQLLFLKKTVREDLCEVGKALGHGKDETEALINFAAEETGITQLLDRHPYDLSGGEQQKAALAKILLTQPRIVFLDEPTKGIDPYGRKQLAEILRSLNAKGVTTVTVTHDAEFAAEYADRCAFLFNGEIIYTDIPGDFFADNIFYTTAASRIARGFFDNAVLCGEVAELCRINGRRNGEI